MEASRFKGREPDESRFDIEDPKLDSTAVRLSWNPTERLALQASWADMKSPEGLEPDEDSKRWSASAIYTAPVGEEGWWSTTLAFGSKDHHGDDLNALALEAAYHPNKKWTFFGRAEGVETEELGGPGVQTLAKGSVGVIRDFEVADGVTLGVGALVSHNWVSDDLSASYDGDQNGAMGFVRLKIGG
jgi:hypothetical protein